MNDHDQSIIGMLKEIMKIKLHIFSKFTQFSKLFIHVLDVNADCLEF